MPAKLFGIKLLYRVKKVLRLIHSYGHSAYNRIESILFLAKYVI